MRERLTSRRSSRRQPWRDRLRAVGTGRAGPSIRLCVGRGGTRRRCRGGGKRKLSRRSFHALRHSFTSALANAGVPPEVRMKLTGHQSAAVHRGYTHHEMGVLRSAVDKLPSLGAGGAKSDQQEALGASVQ
ncbi:MAG: tyrosine-type recombinase/integrase [Limisphaerales bacterium]